MLNFRHFLFELAIDINKHERRIFVLFSQLYLFWNWKYDFNNKNDN